MGKKKKHGKADAGATTGTGPLPLAGLAAMAASQVARQINSPTGRQAMAAGLRAAADALAPKTPPSPEPPFPPAAADDGPSEATRGPGVGPPPDIAKAIGSVAAGLERWAAKLAPAGRRAEP